MFKKAIDFIKRTAIATLKSIKHMFIDVIDNAEGTLILISASIGITTLLSELPYIMLVPAFMESQIVIPVLSVLIIMLLTTSMTHRPKIVSDYATFDN